MQLRRQLDRELDALRDRVLLLGGETETALQRAMHSLVERDSRSAQEVLDGDDRIDRLEVELDRQCIDLIALRQPAARDLRFVISVTKMTPILERVADHACNIARAAIALNDEPQLSARVELPRMGEVAAEMLRAGLDAFASGDAAAARRVIERDAELNAIYGRLFDGLLKLMSADPSTIQRGARLLLVAKHLERIGDYVKDICELTVYMAEASFIKHSK